MDKVNNVDTYAIFSAAEDFFDLGQAVRITVTGMSMYPFLREGIDSVELSRISFNDIKVGDIILAINYNKKYILHRVYKKHSDSFIMWGDGLAWPDHVFKAENVVALVKVVWREDKRIGCSSIGWRFLVFVWTRYKASIHFSFKALRKIKRVIFGFFKL